MPDAGPVRRHVFLIAAAALPLLVVAFFLVATAVPRWLVDPPGHDLLMQVHQGWEPAMPRVAVDLAVRDDRLFATFRRVAENVYPQRARLFRFDHREGVVREVAIDVPDDLAPDEVRTVAVEAIGGARVLSQTAAPDGWVLQTQPRRGPGLVGELLGIGRGPRTPTLMKDGRVIPLDLPDAVGWAGVTHVGWIGGDREPEPR